MNTEISLNEILCLTASHICDALSCLYETEDNPEVKEEAKSHGKAALEKLNDLLAMPDKQQFQIFNEATKKYDNTTGDWWVDDRIREYKLKH